MSIRSTRGIQISESIKLINVHAYLHIISLYMHDKCFAKVKLTDQILIPTFFS